MSISPETLTQQTNLITPIVDKIKRKKYQNFFPNNQQISKVLQTTLKIKKNLNKGNIELILFLQKKGKSFSKTK